MKIIVKKESIIKQEVDAIVNPGNSFGYMGGGVAGAIKKTGGTQIEEEAIENSPVEIGRAMSTTPGDLKCKYVIHAPTMRNPAENTYEHCVREATRAALELAEEMSLKKIAIPGMGTGVGNVPHHEAAAAMVETINEFDKLNLESLEEILLVDIDGKMVEAWNKILKL